jgi:hypothetical protein
VDIRTRTPREISYQQQQQFILCGTFVNVTQRRNENGKSPPLRSCKGGSQNAAPLVFPPFAKLQSIQQAPQYSFFEYSTFQYCPRNILPSSLNKIPGKFLAARPRIQPPDTLQPIELTRVIAPRRQRRVKCALRPLNAIRPRNICTDTHAPSHYCVFGQLNLAILHPARES